MISTKSLIHPLLSTRKSIYFPRRNAPERCKKFIRVSTCIFNLDGSILDNHHVLDKGYRAVFDKYGLEYNQEWALKIMGMTGKSMCEKLIADLNVKAKWEEMHEVYRNAVQESLADAPLKPGIERLVNHLEKNDIPMAVVASSSRATMELETCHIKALMSKFERVTCEDDPQSGKSKPSGWMYVLCAACLKGKPETETCMAFEDTPLGVKAAMDACMQVVAVPSPLVPAESLRHADEVLDTLNDFQPAKYGIPMFPEQIPTHPPL